MSTMALVAFESCADAPRVTHFGVVSLFDCEAADHDKNSDDKMLVGVLLDIKHHSSSTTRTMRTCGTRYGQDAGNLHVNDSLFTHDAHLTSSVWHPVVVCHLEFRRV